MSCISRQEDCIICNIGLQYDIWKLVWSSRFLHKLYRHLEYPRKRFTLLLNHRFLNNFRKKQDQFKSGSKLAIWIKLLFRHSYIKTCSTKYTGIFSFKPCAPNRESFFKAAKLWNVNVFPSKLTSSSIRGLVKKKQRMTYCYSCLLICTDAHINQKLPKALDPALLLATICSFYEST